MKYLLLSITFLLVSCTGIPKDIKPVEPFELQRYLGTWYEIARLDHSFERGLNQITANYTLRDDGGVKVINRGYSQDEKKWKEAEGKAYFVDGFDINDFGDAHDEHTGFCEVIRKGEVVGEVINGRFVASSLKLVD